MLNEKHCIDCIFYKADNICCRVSGNEIEILKPFACDHYASEKDVKQIELDILIDQMALILLNENNK